MTMEKYTYYFENGEGWMRPHADDRDEFYAVEDVHAYVDALEKALKSACFVMSRMRQHNADLSIIAQEAFKEADKALSLMER
jgi:hypothetical protein